MNRIKNRILSFILAIAFIFGSAGVSFADGNAVSEFLYNDPFEYMVSLTDEEIPNSSDSTDVMSVGAENSAESVDERLARRHRERIEKAQKTDRYIVKYKSDAHKTSVENKLHGRLSSTHEIIGENENRTKKTKVIVLNEAIKPQDFANELRNMDIGNSIEYIQPDFELSPQEISLEITEVNGIESISDAEMGTVPMATNPVTVAVIDTGADLSHPLFANYLWEDESGNNGWNFVDENGILYDAEASPSYAHGTHVTGIIVQAARESATPVKVMTCRAFDNGSAYTSDVIEAIEYAQDNGAKIINMSFGGTHYNPALEEAMEETNALFITAAGNHRMDLSTTPVYPACFNLDNIICVASANADKGFTYFSNFSTAHVDIAALGREVTSAYPNKEMGINSGTSMAAAYVSGVAAAVAARDATSTALIKARVLDAADRYAHLENKVANGRYINLNNALHNITATEVSTITVADDFDPIGYDSTPSEQLELFSSRTITQFVSAANHTIMLANDGTVWTFGNGQYGKLGNNNTINVPASAPTQVVGLTDVIKVDADMYNSYAIKSDGTVWSWGAAWNCGTGSSTDLLVPTQISGLQNITLIASYSTHILAYSSSGVLYGWGSNAMGELMSAPFTASVPYNIYEAPGITQLGVGDLFSGVLFGANDSLMMFGTNWAGQLKDQTVGNSYATGTFGEEISVYSFTCGLDHVVSECFSWGYAWGANGSGQVGVDVTADTRVPQEVYTDTFIMKTAAGTAHSLLLDPYGDLYGFGSNATGQLLSATGGYEAAVIATNVADMSSKFNNTVIKKSDGTLWICGANNNNQIDGTETGSYNTLQPIAIPQPTPIPVVASSDLQVVSGNEYNIILNANNSEELENSYILQYDDAYFDIVSLCSFVSDPVTATGEISGTGVNITSNIPGEITFSRSITIPDGKTFTGAINVFKLRAKQTGSTTVTCISGGAE